MSVKELNITSLLQDKKIMLEIYDEAVGRAEEQLEDSRIGFVNATYSYGKANLTNARSLKQRIRDHLKGCMAEYIAAKTLNCEWTKERGQYKNYQSRRPDLIAKYKGGKARIEVRGSGNSFIPFRGYSIETGKDFNEKADTLLLAVSNLPRGPMVKVGYLTFGSLKSLCIANNQWYCNNGKGNPYYKVPIEVFKFSNEDFL